MSGQGAWCIGLTYRPGGDQGSFMGAMQLQEGEGTQSCFGEVDGLPGETGFYHVTTCSNRDGQFVMDYGNFSIPLCLDNTAAQLMDDAGGPGEPIRIIVRFQMPVVTPLLRPLAESVRLTGRVTVQAVQGNV